MTTIYLDSMDLYKERIQGDQYLLDNQWEDLSLRKETIKVKAEKGY